MTHPLLIVILDDDDPMAACVAECAAEAVAAGHRTVRGVVRYLRQRAHRGRNQELEAVARHALQRHPPDPLKRNNAQLQRATSADSNGQGSATN